MAYLNTNFKTRICIALALLTVPAWDIQAIAQSPTPPVSLGSVVASAYSQIPDNSVISVDIKQDSELNSRLLPVIQEELLEHGYKASSDAPLVLRISLEVESSAPPEGRVTVSGQGDNRSVSDAKVTLKVDRNAKNQAKKTWYRLEANLIDQNTISIWKGAANITDGSGRDRREVSEIIVRSLMAEFGATVRNKPIVE